MSTTSQLSCPNSACGRVLMVKAEYAGRTVKCPACGTAMAVPPLGETAAPPTARIDGGAQLAPLGGNGTQPATVAVAASVRSATAAGENAGPPVVVPRLHGVTAALAFGAFALAVLAISPFLGWLTSGPGNTHLNNRLALWAANMFPGVGTVLPQCSLILAAVALVALILAQGRDREQAEAAIATASAAACTWAAFALFWTSAYLWKIFHWPVRDIRDISAGQVVRLQCLPGIGLWIALGGAAVALVLFALPLVQRRRIVWLAGALLLGALLGTAFLYFIVRPWDVYEMQVLPG